MSLSDFSKNRRTINGSFASEGHFNRPLSDLSVNLDRLNSDVSTEIDASDVTDSEISGRLAGYNRGSLSTTLDASDDTFKIQHVASNSTPGVEPNEAVFWSDTGAGSGDPFAYVVFRPPSSQSTFWWASDSVVS